MRRLLKARELGLPEGDTSTLEERHVTLADTDRRPTREHALRCSARCS